MRLGSGYEPVSWKTAGSGIRTRVPPQGGVVSPLLSNVFLHEVLDTWFHQCVRPRLRGRAFLVRYADDAVLGFEYEDDARRVLAVLPKRFGKYGLTLHPEKTRLVEFRRPRRGARPMPGPVLRHAGLHSLLGAVPDGPLGGAAQDGLGSSESSAAAHGPVVPSPPLRARGGPTGGAEPTAARSLPVLRGDRQRTRLSHLPPAGSTPVADLAESALAGSPPELGGVSASPPPLSPHPTARRPQHSPSGSESVGRGAGCPNWARPDLWEPREGNLPGPPGCQRFGPVYARRLRRRRGRLGDTWHLDEVFVTIQGRQQYLWRAVDVTPIHAPTPLRVVKQRLHQASFREAVIMAYNGRCALSGLPEPLLLDAAHIVTDANDRLGQPVVPNGLPLSKIHHAAFDAHLIGIDPDYRLHVSERLLGQHDRPMLKALTRLDGGTIHLPSRAKDRPDRDRLAVRFERFKGAA